MSTIHKGVYSAKGGILQRANTTHSEFPKILIREFVERRYEIRPSSIKERQVSASTHQMSRIAEFQLFDVFRVSDAVWDCLSSLLHSIDAIFLGGGIQIENNRVDYAFE